MIQGAKRLQNIAICGQAVAFSAFNANTFFFDDELDLAHCPDSAVVAPRSLTVRNAAAHRLLSNIVNFRRSHLPSQKSTKVGALREDVSHSELFNACQQSVNGKNRKCMLSAPASSSSSSSVIDVTPPTEDTPTEVKQPFFTAIQSFTNPFYSNERTRDASKVVHADDVSLSITSSASKLTSSSSLNALPELRPQLSVSSIKTDAASLAAYSSLGSSLPELTSSECCPKSRGKSVSSAAGDDSIINENNSLRTGEKKETDNNSNNKSGHQLINKLMRMITSRSPAAVFKDLEGGGTKQSTSPKKQSETLLDRAMRKVSCKFPRSRSWHIGRLELGDFVFCQTTPEDEIKFRGCLSKAEELLQTPSYVCCVEDILGVLTIKEKLRFGNWLRNNTTTNEKNPKLADFIREILLVLDIEDRLDLSTWLKRNAKSLEDPKHVAPIVEILANGSAEQVFAVLNAKPKLLQLLEKQGKEPLTLIGGNKLLHVGTSTPLEAKKLKWALLEAYWPGKEFKTKHRRSLTRAMYGDKLSATESKVLRTATALSPRFAQMRHLVLSDKAPSLTKLELGLFLKWLGNAESKQLKKQ